jgi:hypothetical protein
MSEQSTGKQRMWPTPTSSEKPASTPTPGMGEHWRRKRGNILEAVADDLYPAQPVVSSQLTLFAEAFPASPTPWLASVPAQATSATCGPTSPDSFARVNPDGSWRKTSQGYSQVTLDGSLEQFSETWPRAGMTRNGTAYRRVPSAPLTDAIGSGLWPTPDAAVANIGEHPSTYLKRRAELVKKGSCHGMGYSLGIAAQMWPTPTSRDHKDGTAQSCTNVPANGLLGRVVHQWPTPTQSDGMGGPGSSGRDGGENLRTAAGGSLNPTWVEWLMGYPLEWTALKDWVTRSSRRLRNGSRTASPKLKTEDGK